MTTRRTLLTLCLVVATLAIGALAFVAPGRAQEDQSYLASLISRALSTPAQRVSIGAVEGALSSDATVRDIVLSDRDGPWLRLDRARLVWRRTALLLRRLEIDRLEIGKLEILRKPLPAEEPVAGADQPILPELPVKVEIKEFALGELSVGEPVFGEPVRVGASGTLSLGAPAEGLTVRFDAQRLDSAGTFKSRIEFVPQGNRLEVVVSLDEPAGGFISKVARLQDEPPVKLDLTGSGTLDSFAANLIFDAGPRIGAKGNAQLRREGAGRRLGLDLAAQIAGLLPAPVAPVFPGTTQLKGDMTFADAGTFDLASLALTSEIARLDTKGRYGEGGTLDFAVQARAVPAASGITKAGVAEIRKLVFDGTLTGTTSLPRIAAKLDLEDARLPEGQLQKLDATFTADPTSAVTGMETRFRLAAQIGARGLALSDAALARAIGDRFDLNLRGQTDLSGNGTYETFTARTPSLELAYAGDLGRDRINGRLKGIAPDLSRFGEVAGIGLSGRSNFDLDLEGSPRYTRVTARLAARTERLRTGIAAVDAALGTSPQLDATLRTQPLGRYDVDAFQLRGAHVAADMSGFAAPGDADLRAKIDLADLARLDQRLTGTAALTAHLTNGLNHPNLDIALDTPRATALGRPIQNLSLSARIQDLVGALDARAQLAGSIDREAARSTLRLTRVGESGWRLEGLDATIGSATLKANGEIGADNLLRGTLDINASDLDDLSALALTKLDGRLTARLDFAVPEGRQDVKIAAAGAGLRAGEARLSRIDANVDVRDLYGRPMIDGTLAADEAKVAGETFSAIRFAAKGSAQESDLTLSANARGFDLQSSARLLPGDTTRLALNRFVAQRGTKRIALAGPAELSFANGGVDIRDFVLGLDRGRLAISGRVGDRLDVTASARGIPLSAIDIFVPGTNLAGTFEADAKVGGTTAAPTGTYRISLAQVSAPQTRSNGLPPLTIVANGELQGRQTKIDANVTAGSAGRLTVTGTAPLSATGALDLIARGTLDAALANARLGPAGQRLTGRLNLDLRATGSASSPRLGGSATLAGGTFRDTLQGVQLDAIDLRLRAEGETITIESASARTPKDGRLTATGRVQVDPAAGFPGNLSIRGTRAVLVANDLLNATADLALELSGPLARSPRISGRVDLSRLDVAVPERLPTTLKPIENTRHIAPPPAAAKRLAAAKRARAGAKARGAAFLATLDLTISAPNRIFVRGRGLDAVLGGDLRLTGTTASPVAIGAFDMQRGRLAILGSRLDFTRGRLSFTGDLVPDLDFAASTNAGEVTATVSVTGRADEPAFAFSSQPDLPQDEVLSRILFSKASGGLSPFQALQLAQAASQFAGGGGGDDSFERLRRSLGVDSLDIQAGAGGASVGISRAIGDRVTLGVKAGATPDATGLSADIDVTKRLRIQSQVGADGSTSVGVGAEWEY